LYLLFIFNQLIISKLKHILFAAKNYFMTTKDIFISLALMALWGFNFSVIKLGAMQVDPILLTALRFTFAVIPAIFFVRRPPEAIGFLIAYGHIFGLGVWGMMVWSINLGVSAGMAGLLMDMSIISSLVLGYMLFKEAITFNKILGAVLAVSGLLASLALTDGSVPLRALPLTLIAACSWSLMSVVVKKSKTKHVFAFSVWGMLFAPLPLVLFAYAFNGIQPFVDLPAQLNSQVWFSILFQAYPTTLLGYWIWNRLTVKYPLSTMAPFTLLTPIFGLIGSVIFYHEGVSPMKLLAYALILGGLLVSQWQPKKSPVVIGH
jgi:O-acetylserine/cysteine efflux transporter